MQSLALLGINRSQPHEFGQILLAAAKDIEPGLGADQFQITSSDLEQDVILNGAGAGLPNGDLLAGGERFVDRIAQVSEEPEAGERDRPRAHGPAPEPEMPALA